MFFVIPNRESLVTNGIECLFCWNIPTRWVLCVSSKSKGTLHHPAFSAVAACVGQAAPSRGENKCGWKFEWITSTTLSWYFSDIAKYININIHNQTIIYNNMSMYMMYKYIYIYIYIIYWILNKLSNHNPRTSYQYICIHVPGDVGSMAEWLHVEPTGWRSWTLPKMKWTPVKYSEIIHFCLEFVTKSTWEDMVFFLKSGFLL